MPNQDHQAYGTYQHRQSISPYLKVEEGKAPPTGSRMRTLPRVSQGLDTAVSPVRHKADPTSGEDGNVAEAYEGIEGGALTGAERHVLEQYLAGNQDAVDALNYF